jgi:hypothetical protein
MMNEKPNGNEPLFQGLSVPEPPKELRPQVLSRASQAQGKGPRRDPWARLWESRQVRLAWGASVLALVVGHLVIPAGDPGPAKQAPMQAQSGFDDHEELAGIADLPRLSFDSRPMAASTRIPVETVDDLDPAAPPTVSEENAS